MSHTGVAQLVEQWSPKPKVEGSIPSARANKEFHRKMIDFVKGAYKEFTENVTWPKWNVLQSATVVVAVATLILAVLLFAVDTTLSDMVNGLYSLMR